MTIKDDIKQMFWEPAIDYANAVEPITFETDEELPAQQERWDKVHKAYGKGVEDVLEFITETYDVRLKVPTKHCKCKEPDRDLGQVYCKKCHKDISDGRMRFLANPQEKFEIPADEPDLDEIKRREIRNLSEYNDLCARGTLYPGKTINEVKGLQLLDRIKDAYEYVNNILCGTKVSNTKEVRKWVMDALSTRMDNQSVLFMTTIKCDEENNSPEVVDQNILIAKIMWNPNDGQMGHKYVDMIFGEKSAVEKYQFSWMLDNETFKFIEKGI